MFKLYIIYCVYYNKCIIFNVKLNSSLQGCTVFNSKGKNNPLYIYCKRYLRKKYHPLEQYTFYNSRPNYAWQHLFTR